MYQSVGNYKPTRKLPSSFQRPSVSVGGSPAKKREWKFVSVETLEPDDIVADLGVVHEVSIQLAEDDSPYVDLLVGENQKPITFEYGVMMKAFA